jgi:predicted RNA binding protein YcfA (HicA-like mRNA interferase family)
MRRDFSGREVVKALTKNRFYMADRTGSHVKLRYEHPSNDDDIRVVSVPMHDSIGAEPSGTSPNSPERRTSRRGASGSKRTADFAGLRVTVSFRGSTEPILDSRREEE